MGFDPAPDTGRFRIGVLDATGNDILSFGSYGNQDNCGPDSYVMDPVGKFLRLRRRKSLRDPGMSGARRTRRRGSTRCQMRKGPCLVMQRRIV